MGLHYLPEGEALIKRITQQMNNYRLSTSLHPIIDRSTLSADITKMLSGHSNYEIREGKTYIRSLNRFLKHEELNKAIAVLLVDGQTGNTISTFNSFNDCAKYLDISRTTVANRSLNNNLFKHHDKLVYLKRVPVSSE